VIVDHRRASDLFDLDDSLILAGLGRLFCSGILYLPKSIA